MPASPDAGPGRWHPGRAAAAARRPLAVLALAALVLVATGCDQVSATVEASRELSRNGVSDPVVTVETDAGQRIVTVDYTSRATDSFELAGEEDRIARITWHTIDVQLDAIRVHPATEALGHPPPRRYERAVLIDRFGARPASLGRTDPSTVLTTGLVLAFAVILLLLLAALVGVLWFLRHRRRRAAVPPWMAGPAYPGWDGIEPVAPRPPSPEPAPSWPPATAGHAGYPSTMAPRSGAPGPGERARPGDGGRAPSAAPPPREPSPDR